jgi:CheY-like chemotaxis protein
MMSTMYATNGKRTRVLLVEDEPLICDIATEALEEQGYAVEAVATASEALSCLDSGTPIDVLFTDVNLPGEMDGAALAQRVRQMRPKLPVIYTSGRQSKIEHMQPVDGSMFVPKPYNPFDLGRLFDYLLSAQKIPSQTSAAGAA